MIIHNICITVAEADFRSRFSDKLPWVLLHYYLNSDHKLFLSLLFYDQPVYAWVWTVSNDAKVQPESRLRSILAIFDNILPAIRPHTWSHTLWTTINPGKVTT